MFSLIFFLNLIYLFDLRLNRFLCIVFFSFFAHPLFRINYLTTVFYPFYYLLFNLIIVVNIVIIYNIVQIIHILFCLIVMNVIQRRSSLLRSLSFSPSLFRSFSLSRSYSHTHSLSPPFSPRTYLDAAPSACSHAYRYTLTHARYATHQRDDTCIPPWRANKHGACIRFFKWTIDPSRIIFSTASSLKLDFFSFILAHFSSI